MKLAERHERLLEAIHDTEKERLLRIDLSEKSALWKIEIASVLDFLIQAELVEFDQAEDAYYLTYEGYTEVERIKGRSTNEQAVKHTSRRIGLIVLAVFLVVGIYLTMLGIATNNTTTAPLIDEALLEDIKTEIDKKVDSILTIEEIPKE